MGTFGGAQPIVTDGLVFMLDATNKESFISGNTTIYDLIGDRNGILTNGPLMDGNYSILFDGTNDRIDISSDSLWGLGSTTTINFWFKKYSTLGWLLAFKKGGWIGWAIQANTGFVFSGQNGSNDTAPGFGVTNNNQWYNYTLVVDRENLLWKTYKNGVFIGSSSINHPGAGSYLLHVGSRGQANDSYANMEFGSLSFYDRALTSAEINQNYNALKGRFGL